MNNLDLLHRLYKIFTRTLFLSKKTDENISSKDTIEFKVIKKKK